MGRLSGLQETPRYYRTKEVDICLRQITFTKKHIDFSTCFSILHQQVTSSLEVAVLYDKEMQLFIGSATRNQPESTPTERILFMCKSNP